MGRYTAGAIMTFAYDRPTPIVDTNVARVLSRWFAGRSAGARRPRHAPAPTLGAGHRDPPATRRMGLQPGPHGTWGRSSARLAGPTAIPAPCDAVVTTTAAMADARRSRSSSGASPYGPGHGARLVCVHQPQDGAPVEQPCDTVDSRGVRRYRPGSPDRRAAAPPPRPPRRSAAAPSWAALV